MVINAPMCALMEILNMHFCNMRAKIDFDKVKNVDDLKLVLEAIQIEWPARQVPEKIKHLVKEFDANVHIVNL